MPWWGDLLVGVVILVAAFGCLTPVLPGGLLAWAAVLGWALVERNATGWLVLIVVTALISAGAVGKYVWPSRRLSASGVPGSSILVGGVVGIIGFFVVPFVGLPLGFVLGIFGAELARVRQAAAAWSATVEALKATGLSILIELASVLLAGSVWFTGVLALR